MISKEIIEHFKNKSVNDWTWVKQVSYEDLLSEVQSVAKEFYGQEIQFKTKPFKHQLATILLGLYNKYFLFFLDMGTGKTFCSLVLTELFIKSGKCKRALVLVPNSASVDGWADEVRKHSNLTCTQLLGTIEDRWKLLKETDTNLYVTNYTGFQLLCSSFSDAKGKKKGKRTGDKNKLAYFKSKFDMLILDECHSYGLSNKTSLTFKLVDYLSKGFKARYGLTGTPMGRNPEYLWGQYYLIDRGETLSTTLSFFREAFFTCWKTPWGSMEWNFDKRHQGQLNRLVGNYSIRYEEKEANDLPELVHIHVPLCLSKEARTYYNRIMEGLVKTDAEFAEIENKYHTLRRLASGYLDTGKENVVYFKDNRKLEKLEEILEGLDDGGKCIVFNEYINTGNLISDFLKKLKIKHTRLYSGTKDKIEAKNTFITDPTCKVLVANSASGNVSLNLQVANYVVFFESPVSPIIKAQAIKRAHRTGQEKKVFCYDFYVKNTIEEKILKYIKEGKDLFQAIITRKESFL